MQRLLEVFDQIVDVLEAHGDAQEIVRRDRAGPFDGDAVLDETLGAAEAGGLGEERESARDAERLGRAFADLDESMPPKCAHLARGDGVFGVRLESG